MLPDLTVMLQAYAHIFIIVPVAILGIFLFVWFESK